MSYEYVYDCIHQNQSKPTARYTVRLPHIVCKVTVEPSIQCQFKKKRSFISLVRGPCSEQTARRNVKLVNNKKQLFCMHRKSLLCHWKVTNSLFFNVGRCINPPYKGLTPFLFFTKPLQTKEDPSERATRLSASESHSFSIIQLQKACQWL